MLTLTLWGWAIGLLLYGLGSMILGSFIGQRLAARHYEQIIRDEEEIKQIEREKAVRTISRGFTLNSIKINRK